MYKITKLIEKRIEDPLLERFSLILDGWSANEIQYVEIFAFYPSTRACGFDKVLLGFSPLGDEEKISAEGHLEYIQFFFLCVRKYYRK